MIRSPAQSVIFVQFSFWDRHCTLYKCTCCPGDIFPCTDAKSKWGARFSKKEPLQARQLHPHCFAPRQGGSSPSFSARAAAPCAVPRAGSGPTAQGSVSPGAREEVTVPGWAEKGGGGCYHSQDMLGIRQSQHYLEGCCALGVNFGPQSLHSRCHDFCWSWKINLGGSDLQLEELATLLEAPLHAPDFKYWVELLDLCQQLLRQ